MKRRCRRKLPCLKLSLQRVPPMGSVNLWPFSQKNQLVPLKYIIHERQRSAAIDQLSNKLRWILLTQPVTKLIEMNDGQWNTC